MSSSFGDDVPQPGVIPSNLLIALSIYCSCIVNASWKQGRWTQNNNSFHASTETDQATDGVIFFLAGSTSPSFVHDLPQPGVMPGNRLIALSIYCSCIVNGSWKQGRWTQNNISFHASTQTYQATDGVVFFLACSMSPSFVGDLPQPGVMPGNRLISLSIYYSCIVNGSWKQGRWTQNNNSFHASTGTDQATDRVVFFLASSTSPSFVVIFLSLVSFQVTD